MLQVGHKIRKIRVIKSIDAKVIADDLHISTSQLSRIENDEVKIDVELVQRFADYFKMPLTDVITFDDKPNVINNNNSTVSNGGVNFGTINDPAIFQNMMKLILEKLESLDGRVQALEKS
ncbi:MAG TPA: helix-turn-helix transcriptional regulator [Bacteroidia bacterium]|nr:helix-turn-helix transcriptional regulator [Bacteroidia bacterium]HNU32447.1 helix-turn-helix transcriptional regulator [Bacteroidia bacterium]